MQCISSQVSFSLFFFIHSLTYVIYRLKMMMGATINTTTTIPITHSNTGYDPPQQGSFFLLHLMGAGYVTHLQLQEWRQQGQRGPESQGTSRFVSPLFYFIFLNIFFIIFMPESQGTRDVMHFMSPLCFF